MIRFLPVLCLLMMSANPQDLTLEEKVAVLHGNSKFTTAGVPRLGIPKRWLSDGPHGVREDVGPDTWKPAGRTDDFATCMPAGIALAATWNPDLAFAEGAVIGDEAAARGKHIMLGPGVNIMRTPLCGRNFEYFGEDSFLASRIAVGYICGEQSNGVASCVKHFAANNQEFERDTINVEMDERTLREIYLPAFRAAVQEAGVVAVMGAYNKFRGEYCCQNDYLLNKILKSEWGFQGLVVSDWNATHDTRGAVLGGLDVEMGTKTNSYDDYFLARPLLDAMRAGEFPMSLLDDKVQRNLRQMLRPHPTGSLNTEQHQETARRVAEEGIVLLKNAGILPLNPTSITSIAVIGENAVRLQAHGGGSSTIKALYEITPLDGILRRIGDHANVTYSPGSNAVAAARAADVAVVVAGLDHSRYFDDEGYDRTNLKLPSGQAELIQRVVEANPRTVVVIIGTVVEMDPWLASVPAVLQAWYPGMEGGSALARVLFGDVNPSGKLPCTFPKRLEDSPAHALGAYPGTNGVVRYVEGRLVGYRWFDAKNIEPLFPFGYGLSYTKFEYSALNVTTNSVEFELANVGSRAGAEVAQLYIRGAEAYQELKGFRKVFLQPGEKRNVTILLKEDSFAHYSPERAGWFVQGDKFAIRVGSSSRDIRLEKEIHR
jgi:beta-glucosidase